MPRPCHRKHAAIDPTCDFCRAAFKHPTLRKKWGCDAEFATVGFESMAPPVVAVSNEKLRNPPRSICGHRGDRIGTCAGCGGLPKYACTVYGETTATKCLTCDQHTERTTQTVELGLPALANLPVVPRPDGVRYHDPATGTVKTMAVAPPVPSPEHLTRLLVQARSGQAFAPPAANGKLEWISTKQLVVDTLALIGRLPHDLAGIVGIPRSGMLPASILATHLHLPLYQFADGKAQMLASGSRGSEATGGKLLVIDDTVYRGTAIQQARATLKDALFAAVYVRPEAASVVDFHGRLLPSPHLCEWNLFNNGPLKGDAANRIFGAGVATDFDGILCLDPDVPDADDGPGLERYRQWLINAKPGSLLPRKHAIPLIVTGRLERFRSETEEWLKRHRIKWGQLVMYPADKASERKDVAEWKGRVFGESACGFFVESDARQAPTIAEVSGKPVICPATETVYRAAKKVAVAVPEGVSAAKYPAIEVRHLAYVILPIAGNGVWQRNLDRLIPHLGKFNGRRRVAILTGSPSTRYHLDSPRVVKEYLAGHNCEFVEKPNNPASREGEIWTELFEPLQTAKENEAIFFAHAKGVTREPTNMGHRWATAMYRICLETWPYPMEMLEGHPIVGPFKYVGTNFARTPSKWQYNGSFYWVRAAEMFRRDWRRLDQHWCAVESWPGLHFSVEEGGMLFPSAPIGNLDLYQPTHMMAKERDLEEFLRTRGERRSPTTDSISTALDQSVSSLIATGKYSTDKESWHSYASGFYDAEFARICGRPIRLLEIGVQTGGSLRLWADYFPSSEIVGVDRNLSRLERDVASDRRIKILNGDAYDRRFVATITGEFDIVIDDGSHRIEDQVKFIELYLPKTRFGGLIVVEDIKDPAHFERLKSVLPEKLRGRTMCIDLRRPSGRPDSLLLAVQH